MVSLSNSFTLMALGLIFSFQATLSEFIDSAEYLMASSFKKNDSQLFFECSPHRSYTITAPLVQTNPPHNTHFIALMHTLVSLIRLVLFQTLQLGSCNLVQIPYNWDLRFSRTGE